MTTQDTTIQETSYALLFNNRTESYDILASGTDHAAVMRQARAICDTLEPENDFFDAKMGIPLWTHIVHVSEGVASTLTGKSVEELQVSMQYRIIDGVVVTRRVAPMLQAIQFDAWELDTATKRNGYFYDHSSISHLDVEGDSKRYGTIASRFYPNEYPADLDERIKVVHAHREACEMTAYQFILKAYPEARNGKCRGGSIEIGYHSEIN